MVFVMGDKKNTCENEASTSNTRILLVRPFVLATGRPTSNPPSHDDLFTPGAKEIFTGEEPCGTAPNLASVSKEYARGSSSDDDDRHTAFT